MGHRFHAGRVDLEHVELGVRLGVVAVGQFMSTWRDVLTQAQEDYRSATERRVAVMRQAHDAGLSYREIGEGVGTSASNVHKLIGGVAKPKRDKLDDEATDA